MIISKYSIFDRQFKIQNRPFQTVDKKYEHERSIDPMVSVVVGKNRRPFKQFGTQRLKD